MTKNNINSPVYITSLVFGRGNRAVPRRMEYLGTSYSFIDSGLRTVVERAGETIEILTMSDGVHDFRLRRESRSSNWTLLSIA